MAESIPRWAKELGEETWLRINEMLLDGFDTPDVMRELQLPEKKLRSLQLHARQYGPRRRLEKFEKFKNALASGGADLSGDFMQALKLVAECACSRSVKESTQQNAVRLMTDFTKVLTGLMNQDVATEKERREQEQAATRSTRPEEIVEQILATYGIDPEGTKARRHEGTQEQSDEATERRREEEPGGSPQRTQGGAEEEGEKEEQQVGEGHPPYTEAMS